VADLWNELTEKFGSLVGKWTSYAAFGTFLLYLFGYLALRFQLSTYGVATNLDVFDERYLFAGIRFVVYLVSAIPNVLLVAFVLAAIGYLPYRLLRSKAKVTTNPESVVAHPARWPLLGSLVALMLIQFVLRKCFVFGNLLFARQLSEYRWLNSLLLADDTTKALYFSGLVAGTMLSGALLYAALRSTAVPTAFSRLLVALLVFLIGVQFLLLPVNYGILVASSELPRVADLPGEKLAEGTQAWLVWETKEARVYFLREPDGKRAMLTIPEKNAKLKVIGYDDIFRILFAGAAPSQPDTKPGDSHD
jgi:Protein of unknown function (DUF2700)